MGSHGIFVVLVVQNDSSFRHADLCPGSYSIDCLDLLCINWSVTDTHIVVGLGAVKYVGTNGKSEGE